METLKNGATLIHKQEDKVFANMDGEFVIWTINADGDTFWGHYFGSDFNTAAKVFAELTEGDDDWDSVRPSAIGE